MKYIVNLVSTEAKKQTIIKILKESYSGKIELENENGIQTEESLIKVYHVKDFSLRLKRTDELWIDEDLKYSEVELYKKFAKEGSMVVITKI